MLIKLTAKYCALFVYIGFLIITVRFFSSLYDKLFLKIKKVFRGDNNEL